VVTPAIVNKNEQPPTISVSGSFRLRPLRIKDAPALFAYLCDPRVLEHTSFPLFDMAGVRRIIEWQIAGVLGRGLMLVSAHAVVDWAFSDAGFNRVHAFGRLAEAIQWIQSLRAMGVMSDHNARLARVGSTMPARCSLPGSDAFGKGRLLTYGLNRAASKKQIPISN
jgi:hypothetical protein